MRLLVRKERHAELREFVDFGEAGIPDRVEWRVLVLEPVQIRRAALRDQQVHRLPVAETEHRAILVDEIPEDAERVGIVGLVNGGLTITGNVQQHRPGHDAVSGTVRRNSNT